MGRKVWRGNGSQLCSRSVRHPDWSRSRVDRISMSTSIIPLLPEGLPFLVSISSPNSAINCVPIYVLMGTYELMGTSNTSITTSTPIFKVVASLRSFCPVHFVEETNAATERLLNLCLEWLYDLFFFFCSNLGLETNSSAVRVFFALPETQG